MKSKRGGQAKTSAKLRRAPLRSWYFWGGLAGLLAGASGAGFWFRSEIAEAVTRAQDAVLATLGLGVAPTLILLAVSSWILLKRRSWLRRVNLWAGSLVFLAFVLGVLAFFQPYDGALATFARDGEGSLGGTVGDSIAGPTGAQGVLRLLGVFALGAAIAAPTVTLVAASMLGKSLVFIYVFAFVAVKGAVSSLSRMYRFEPKPPPEEGAVADRPAESLSASEKLTAERRDRIDALAGRGIATRALATPGVPLQGRSLAVGPYPSGAGARTAEPRPSAAVARSEVQTVALGRPSPAVAEVETKAGADLVRWGGPTPDSGPDEDNVSLEPRHASGEDNVSLEPRHAPGEDNVSLEPRHAPGEDNVSLEPRHAPGEDNVSLEPRHVPGEDNVSLEPRHAPGEDNVSLEPRHALGGDSVSLEPRHVPGEDNVSLEPRHASGEFDRIWGSETGSLEPGNEMASLKEPELDEDDETDDSPAPDEMGGSWELPPTHLLLDAAVGGISKQHVLETAETIERTLADYGVEVEIGQIRPGPTVTMYGLIPGWVRRHKQVKVTDEKGRPKLDESGKPIYTNVETKTRVKVDSITSREKDLSLALKTPSLRIETPVMGEALLGIEVPNPTPDLVTLRSATDSAEFKSLLASAKLPIALGKGSGGDTVVVDLAKMPHLLIAGATGSGKSVCLNTIVSCLLMEKTPAEMRLLLVDPKRVELTPYNGIPHLLTPVVVETDQVVALLKGLIREMLARYRRFEEISVRNIGAFNKKTTEKMPYLVLVVDELADLMMAASFDVEQSLCRLAQLGRATGIHLIVATQRPSVDVVTGLIKANFPSRLSFGVTSQIDSRTILDTAGAEKLLGKGDMLYLPADGARPARVQGVFISDREIDDLVRFWQTTRWAPLPTVSLHTVGDGEAEEEDGRGKDNRESRDKLLDDAVDLAQRYQKLSTSLLQRRLRIGYPRAARLMDELEEEGIIGPSDGSKSRDVIIGSM